MSYQVLARKWRPQRFDDVVGQPAVTKTLRNALASRRLAQAFVFAGPRGVGKTTTARILARALSCVNGPTPEPCGVCDACVEIAEGRDIDVLEIDAATHTGVDNVREVIIAGLGIVPVRNRYKVFIIDEVHQLSLPSFNALLKSIEEPPPHVVFMMATTELEKIPETVLSRSQVHEFRTIGTRAIAEQLRRIADAEGLTASDAALQLIARDADGSMRDAQSRLDQVIAFTGQTIDVDGVTAVLGLVGRDLLLDAVQAVAAADAAAAFDLAGRAVDLGYDLRLVCRELSRLVRDLLVLSVDPSRTADPEIAGEGERDRLLALSSSFSREDLLRAFDLLTKAEADIRVSAQPRYHLEMAFLRWIYLRRIRPIEDVIASMEEGGGRGGAAGPSGAGRLSASAAASVTAGRTAGTPARAVAPAPPVASPAAPARRTGVADSPSGLSGPASPASRPAVSSAATNGVTAPPGTPAYKDALLAEIRRSKAVFYNTVVAQAQSVDVTSDRVTFTFAPAQGALRQMCEQGRGWLEPMAQQLAGRRIAVVSAEGQASAIAATEAPLAAERHSALRERALADENVQALLDVFPAEIRDVEEM